MKKDEAYVEDLVEYKSKGFHWIALHMNSDNITYFDSFWVEHVPKEILKIHKNKNRTANIYVIQANYLIIFL